MERFQFLQVFPWNQAVVTARDEGEIAPNQLTVCENYYFNPAGDRLKRDGINFNWDSGPIGNALLDGTDFIKQVGNSKIAFKVTIDASGNLYSYDTGGIRTKLVDNGTPWASQISQASFLTFNNELLIAVDGDDNVVKYWDGTNPVQDLPGAPLASILQQHLNRVWTNDKTNLDRINYCETGNSRVWLGAGDSAALNITPGDGDPVGISAIFPTFQGTLYVTKRTKLYTVTGLTPDSFGVTAVSSGIGCLSQRAFATIDQQDIVFASERGFHQLTTTLNFGNFQSSYISADIQNKFVSDFNYSRRSYIKAIYLPQISCVGFAVTDESYGSQPYNNVLWLYNLNTQQLAWHNWPIPSECIFMSRDADNVRPYFGTPSGRLARGFNGTNFDINEAGTNVAIPVRLRTGRIFPGGSPLAVVGFKYFGLIYRPTSAHQIDVSVQIDDFAPQSLTFDETTSLDLLGSTFILDESILGSGTKLIPFTQPIDGYGRGIIIDISSQDVDVQHSLMGFVVAYEKAETSQETVLGSGGGA